jgi:A repeated domain in UCH-protein
LLPPEDRRLVHDNPNLGDADRDLLRVLAAQDYDKHTSARTAILDPATRSIRYSALGAPQNASDELLSFAYREQIRTNGREAPKYLSYLHQIAQERRSELLDTLVATEYSAGKVDEEQLIDAYQYFSLALRDNGITDDHIIGVFRARLQDAARQESDMRARLKIIGVHRASQRIIDVAEDGRCLHGMISSSHNLPFVALNTYEQALAFFDAQATLPDEFFPTLYTTKVSALSRRITTQAPLVSFLGLWEVRSGMRLTG